MPDAPSSAAPLILALETATSCGSVALVGEGRCLAEFSLNTSRSHSRRLLAGVELLLAETERAWAEVDAIAVSLGPGSFTGLRIGLATAKGLCFATGKPLIGVPTLEGLAAQFPFAGLPIRPLLDARKKEVYTGLYQCSAEGGPRQAEEFQVLPPERLIELVEGPTLLVGDALLLYGAFFRERLREKALLAPPQTCFPRAAAIGLAAQHRFTAGAFSEAATCAPIYVRASDAELQLGAKTSPRP